jgi:hypothetical protein
MSKKKVFCFGSGFRKFESVRSVNVFPSQRPEEIALQVDPVESFRFEKIEVSDNQVSYRIRSDVSMLLHAADLAKRVGASTAQRFMDSKSPRSSSLQEQLDKLNPSDDELLSMVKSRYLQHPSEILAWVESINELAEDMKSDALKQLVENEAAETSTADSGVDSSGTADSR